MLETKGTPSYEMIKYGLMNQFDNSLTTKILNLKLHPIGLHSIIQSVIDRAPEKKNGRTQNSSNQQLSDGARKLDIW